MTTTRCPYAVIKRRRPLGLHSLSVRCFTIQQVHGSPDSLDLDVVYVVPLMPSARDCNTFCNADQLENRNLVVIRNGVVVDTFKVCWPGAASENKSLTVSH